MTPTPSPDRLEDLLRETFAAQEHLADDAPRLDVAAGAPSSGGGRRLALAGVAAAVAVTAVVTGTTYLGNRGGHAPESGPGPRPSHPTTTRGVSSAPAGGSTADNKGRATRLAARVSAGIPSYPGAREARATDVPPLAQATTFSGPPDFTVNRTRFWTAAGSAGAVALWYAAHPPAGFTSDGGRAGVGSESDGAGTFINDVYLDQTPPQGYAPVGAAILVQTTDLADGRVGVRASVDAVWRPARPATSYVSGVISIEVHYTDSGQSSLQRGPRFWTVTDPDRVHRLTRAYNRLPGWPEFFHSCPAMINTRSYHIVFHTFSGEVTATGQIACYDTLEVRRDGHRVGPYLDHAADLISLIDPHASTQR